MVGTRLEKLVLLALKIGIYSNFGLNIIPGGHKFKLWRLLANGTAAIWPSVSLSTVTLQRCGKLIGILPMLAF